MTKRAERFAEKYGGMTIGELLNAEFDKQFGTVTRQMPIVTSQEGIKMVWDLPGMEYPSEIRLKMTDGQWIRYRIEAGKQAFEDVMRILENPVHERAFREQGGRKV